MPTTSSSPIRVAEVVRPAEGGMRRHVSILVNSLDLQRFTPVIYAPAQFELEGSDTNRPVPKVPLEIASRTDTVRDLKAINKLSRMLNASSDLLHAHGLRAAIVGVSAAKRAGIPAVFTAHNVPPNLNLLQKLALKYVVRNCHKVITVSDAISTALHKHGVDRLKLQTIPNGIDLKRFVNSKDLGNCRLELKLPIESPVLLYLGRLSPEKGVDVLIDAFKSIAQSIPDTVLLITGSGPELESLKIQADGNPNVRFLGFRTDISALAQIANIVVVPSRTEGQGISAIEAMAAGKPVVASDVGGLPETVSDQISGLLVPPDNPKALARAVLELLVHPELCIKMGEAGREIAFSKYSATRMVSAIENCYVDALKSRSQ